MSHFDYTSNVSFSFFIFVRVHCFSFFWPPNMTSDFQQQKLKLGSVENVAFTFNIFLWLKFAQNQSWTGGLI